eukprot:COSAG01_NODE_16583_length_1223_cov_3.446619_2_plen_108_part_00
MANIPTLELQTIFLDEFICGQNTVGMHEPLQQPRECGLASARVACDDNIQTLLQHLAVTGSFYVLNLPFDLGEHILSRLHANHSLHLLVDNLSFFRVSIQTNAKITF